MSLLLCAIFFVSGAAGLIFEALWFRQTGLTFGNSVTASSLVLASFMSGLALGSALVARWGSRIARPLRAQFERVHAALPRTRLTTLPLWLLGSDGDRIDAVRRLIAAGSTERKYAADLARSALAERRYAEAAQRFATARVTRPGDRRLLRLDLYSLYMAGKTEAAARVARAAGRRDGEAGWWRWLQTTFGIAPGSG